MIVNLHQERWCTMSLSPEGMCTSFWNFDNMIFEHICIWCRTVSMKTINVETPSRKLWAFSWNLFTCILHSYIIYMYTYMFPVITTGNGRLQGTTLHILSTTGGTEQQVFTQQVNNQTFTWTAPTETLTRFVTLREPDFDLLFVCEIRVFKKGKYIPHTLTH